MLRGTNPQREFLFKVNMGKTFVNVTNWARFVHYAGPVEGLRTLEPTDLAFEKQILLNIKNLALSQLSSYPNSLKEDIETLSKLKRGQIVLSESDAQLIDIRLNEKKIFHHVVGIVTKFIAMLDLSSKEVLQLMASDSDVKEYQEYVQRAILMNILAQGRKEAEEDNKENYSTNAPLK